MYLRKQTSLNNGYSMTEKGLDDIYIGTDRSFYKSLPIIDGMRIIDVGCGKAMRDIGKIKELHDVTIFGIDQHLGTPIDILETFTDNSFDIAYCNSLFCELDDEQVKYVMKHIGRIAKEAFYTELKFGGSLLSFVRKEI